jgi:XRE family transcriptional regulator, regulator of sulfur utilization
MNLGYTIQKIRKQLGVKQNEFAKICDITPAYLSLIESNRKEPNLSTIKVIAKNLDVPLPILFFLSLDESDINPNKQEAYKIIAPSIKSLIGSFFTEKND